MVIWKVRRAMDAYEVALLKRYCKILIGLVFIVSKFSYIP